MDGAIFLCARRHLADRRQHRIHSTDRHRNNYRCPGCCCRGNAGAGGETATDVVTHTFLFPADIVLQAESPPEGFPKNWGTNSINGLVASNYEMDPVIAAEQPEMAADLALLPSMEITIDPEDLFGSQAGLWR